MDVITLVTILGVFTIGVYFHLLQRIEAGFKRVDKRFQKIDEKFQKMDERLAEIEKDMLWIKFQHGHFPKDAKEN